MDVNEFREFGRAAIDFAADYLENIRDRHVLPSVAPGYLHELLPNTVNEKPESWQDVMKDFERVIVPGLTHWQSPNFHANYPTQTCYASIVGETLAASLGIVGFSWMSSPACTELEVIVMDWLCKFLELPTEFLNSSDGPGGGAVQGSSSEAILAAIIAAREHAVKRMLLERPELSETDIRGKLIAYSSDQSNSAVAKAGRLASVPMRLLDTDDNGSLIAASLQEAIDEDMALGKFPIICVATLGTTPTCAYDDLEQLGPICRTNHIWLHVDAAYAGAALCCPEYRPLMKGLQWADSFNFSLTKLMLVNYDCCAMWLRDVSRMVDSYTVTRIYLEHKYQGHPMAPDLRHWQLSLGRRFRALKMWIVLRTMGGARIREHIRNYGKLAAMFERLVLADDRFEVVTKRSIGLVCFRLKGGCQMTRELLERVTERRQIYMSPCTWKGQFVVRYVVCGHGAQETDVEFAWKEIQGQVEVDMDVVGSDKTVNTFAEDLSVNGNVVEAII